MSKRKLIICTDDEKFTDSECNCEFCKQMKGEVAAWNTLVPKTNLQKRMVDVIKKIEDREKGKSVKRMRQI